MSQFRLYRRRTNRLYIANFENFEWLKSCMKFSTWRYPELHSSLTCTYYTTINWHIDFHRLPPTSADFRHPPTSTDLRRLPPTSDIRRLPPTSADFHRLPTSADFHRPPPTSDLRRLPPTSADFHRLPTSADFHRLPPTSADFRPPPTSTDLRRLPPTSADFRPLPTSTDLRRLPTSADLHRPPPFLPDWCECTSVFMLTFFQCLNSRLNGLHMLCISDLIETCIWTLCLWNWLWFDWIVWIVSRRWNRLLLRLSYTSRLWNAGGKLCL